MNLTSAILPICVQRKSMLLLTSATNPALGERLGTGSGYAMKFQGTEELAAIKTKFSDATAGTFPTVSGGNGMVWI